jgi:hypothetical protein
MTTSSSANLSPIPRLRDGDTVPTERDINDIQEFFETLRIADNNVITIREAEAEFSGGTIVRIEEYESTIVGRYLFNGDLHVVTAAGHRVNVSAMVEDIRAAASEA